MDNYHIKVTKPIAMGLAKETSFLSNAGVYKLLFFCHFMGVEGAPSLAT